MSDKIQLMPQLPSIAQLNATFFSEFFPSLSLSMKLEDQNEEGISYLRTYYGIGIPFAVVVQLSWLISMEYCKRDRQ